MMSFERKNVHSWYSKESFYQNVRIWFWHHWVNSSFIRWQFDWLPVDWFDCETMGSCSLFRFDLDVSMGDDSGKDQGLEDRLCCCRWDVTLRIYTWHIMSHISTFWFIMTNHISSFYKIWEFPVYCLCVKHVCMYECIYTCMCERVCMNKMNFILESEELGMQAYVTFTFFSFSYLSLCHKIQHKFKL